MIRALAKYNLATYYKLLQFSTYSIHILLIIFFINLWSVLFYLI